VAGEHNRRPHDLPANRSDGVAAETPGAAVTALTPAEEHALRRSAPLSPTQFEKLGRLAARGINPLRKL
jgi:hypothetical protein